MLRSVDETIATLLRQVKTTEATEQRALDDALNCCLAADIASPVDVPPADNSAMDGYALKHGDVSDGVWLEVSGRIAAGSVGRPLESGGLVRIFTGALLPPGADTVVIQEATETRGGAVRIMQMPQHGENVRKRGQDIEKGRVILARGERLTSAGLGLIASVGFSRVAVYTPLRIAIMSTGDELVQPGKATAPGQIYNSNRYTLAALISSMGMQVVDLGIVADTPEATEEALREAAARADCILTTGGVSVGEADHVKAAVGRLGHIDLWKLAIKPGKPLAYGEVEGVPFFGLPGNPVSTFVTFFIIARPCLMAMQGVKDVTPVTHVVESGFEFKAGGRREYLRVRTVEDDRGETRLEKFPNQGSGIMTSLAWADALAEVEAGRHVMPGDRLRIFPLQSPC